MTGLPTWKDSRNARSAPRKGTPSVILAQGERCGLGRLSGSGWALLRWAKISQPEGRGTLLRRPVQAQSYLYLHRWLVWELSGKTTKRPGRMISARKRSIRVADREFQPFLTPHSPTRLDLHHAHGSIEPSRFATLRPDPIPALGGSAIGFRASELVQR
jgi:hypothetical protein